MHQVLYIVQLPNEEGDKSHAHYVALMPCDPNLVSSAFIQSLYSLFKLHIHNIHTCT